MKVFIYFGDRDWNYVNRLFDWIKSDAKFYQWAYADNRVVGVYLDSEDVVMYKLLFGG